MPRLAVLLAGALCIAVSSRALAADLHWTAEIQNLSFDELNDSSVAALRGRYALELARALGISRTDVFDDEGRAEAVSLGGPAALGPNASHHDYRPGEDPAAPAPTTETSTTTASSAGGVNVSGSIGPLRGICYGALPCKDTPCGGQGLPPDDMLQAGYEAQWGKAGRDDLGVMRQLGANAVRLYHSFGTGVDADHGGFLDRAHEVGLNVLPGFHTELANFPGECDAYDCFDSWKKATLKGFKQGFQQGSAWHPAVQMVILLNEPDFFRHAPKCVPSGSWCHTKAAISALDGVLAAEREAGVVPGRVRLTVTWSFAMQPSIDGKVNGPGIFGFQDMVAAVADPQIANYTPRTPMADLSAAFKARWVHGLNTQAPWSFVNEVVSKDYAQFAPTPWFIGEYGGNGQPKDVIMQDLVGMQTVAAQPGSTFLGGAMFQFQTAYFKGGSELNFGLLGLGDEQIGRTGELCRSGSGCGQTWPVYCLSTDLSWLSGSLALRAKAVAEAWGGVVGPAPGFCGAGAEKANASSASMILAVSGARADKGVGAGSFASTTPLRGIAYGALPCKQSSCGGDGLPSEDMLQESYEPEWGASGRDDLGTIAAVGANAVRLYHSFGLGVDTDHGKFLNRAHEVGLDVMAGYHTENANNPAECPEYDCFETWKADTLAGFGHGYKVGAAWHPAVSALILLNEPDFFEGSPKCSPSGPWCRVKAALSALDGVLAAEREAGVEPGRVKLTITWSFAMKASIDGKVQGPGIFGFQDMVAGVADPSIAGYAPRTPLADIARAFKTRWMHGLNTQAPWKFVNEMVSQAYAPFAPTPWFIGEYGGNGQPKGVILQDLQGMETVAAQDGNNFLGAAMFQFQTTYWKGGAEMNFGLFGLGDEKVGETGALCDKLNPNCRTWPVYCLTANLQFLPGELGQRAEAVADAWRGSVSNKKGFCSAGRRLGGQRAAGTLISAHFRISAGTSADAVESRLSREDVSAKIAQATLGALGDNSAAVLGPLRLDGARVELEDGGSVTERRTWPWWGWTLAGVLAGLVALGAFAALLLGARGRKGAREADHHIHGTAAHVGSGSSPGACQPKDLDGAVSSSV